MNTNIFIKSGFLSAYGFACGYIQKYSTDNFEVQLYREHSIYHLRFIRITEFSRSVDFWQCFDNLNGAKKMYNKLIKAKQCN